MTDRKIFELESPLGPLTIIHQDGVLLLVEFSDRIGRITPTIDRLMPVKAAPHPAISPCFQRYFNGDINALSTLAYSLSGTDFQRRVWTALTTIPAGESWSYGQLAATIQSHPRAVGMANGQNSLALVIPCHRVIGSDGSLTGYAGGLSRKEWLLSHEGALPAKAKQASLF